MLLLPPRLNQVLTMCIILNVTTRVSKYAKFQSIQPPQHELTAHFSDGSCHGRSKVNNWNLIWVIDTLILDGAGAGCSSDWRLQQAVQRPHQCVWHAGRHTHTPLHSVHFQDKHTGWRRWSEGDGHCIGTATKALQVHTGAADALESRSWPQPVWLSWPSVAPCTKRSLV